VYPNSDHGLTQGTSSRRPAPGEEKRYPGLVAVHGGYHFSLDEEFFGFIERAAAEGYVVIFPEYRGAAATGPNTTRRRTTGART